MKRNIKNLRIISVLLSYPDGSLTKYRLAKLAECTKPWVISFLRKLEKENIVKFTKVLDHDKLIDYYHSIAKKQNYASYDLKDPANFLKDSKMQYALTTYVADNLTNKNLFPARYDVYIKKEDFERWKFTIMKEKGLIGGGNLRLIISDDDFIFSSSQEKQGLSLVSDAKLLIDLKDSKDEPCKEAYMIIRRKYKNENKK